MESKEGGRLTEVSPEKETPATTRMWRGVFGASRDALRAEAGAAEHGASTGGRGSAPRAAERRQRAPPVRMVVGGGGSRRRSERLGLGFRKGGGAGVEGGFICTDVEGAAAGSGISGDGARTSSCGRHAGVSAGAHASVTEAERAAAAWPATAASGLGPFRFFFVLCSFPFLFLFLSIFFNS